MFRFFTFVATLWGMSAAVGSTSGEEYELLRDKMISEEIEAAGVTHAGVLRSMRATTRHHFVPAGFRKQAYFDAALPIGEKQTISPPFVVAYMTEQLDPKPTDRVLEIGTGSGYQAAVLSPLVKEVYTIEIVERLGLRAQRTLRQLGYENVHVRIGDGYQGWVEHAPFDKIMVTCSPESIPAPLVDQLAEGGQMIIPVGERYQQNLTRVTKRDGKLHREPLRATLFVPMTGTAESSRKVHPNPQQPAIVNGGFESKVGADSPAGWHYLRQAKLVTEDPQTPAGRRYLSLENSEPGCASRALQGMALDGRTISRVRLSAWVRGQQLAAGPTPEQRAAILITFYDARRAVIESQHLADWQGTFEWTSVSKTIRVPLATREAILRVGLLGGLGRLDVDQISIVVENPNSP